MQGLPTRSTAVETAPPERVRLPWVGRTVGVFLVARAVTSAFLVWLTTITTSVSRAGSRPSFASISSIWDGQWYGSIALHGYPAVLPRVADGSVAQNPWAFLPAYPWLVQVVSVLTGLPWAVVGIAVSVAFGAGCAVLLRMLLAPRIGSSDADFSIVVFSVSPLSFMLQMTYPESMMLFLLLAALLLIERRRYLALVPVVLVAGFTRPSLPALALALLVHLLVRRSRAARSGVPIGSAETVRGLVALAATSGAAVVWPVIAAVATGVPDAYFATEAAWRIWVMGAPGFSVVVPWFRVATLLFGSPLGPVVVLLLVGGAIGLLLARPVRRLGGTVRIWIASYLGFLFALFMPQTSVLRLMIPLAPLSGAVVGRRASYRVVLVLCCLLAQAAWLYVTYGPVTGWWSVP